MKLVGTLKECCKNPSIAAQHSCIIYVISNKLNGKQYVGLTKNGLWNRIYNHIRRNFLIGRAIRKYGLRNFNMHILDYASTKDKLCKKERFWIDKLDCITPKGYNLTPGGEGASWYRHSLKTIREMSRKTVSSRTRQKISKTLKGHTVSFQTRKKISEGNKGKDISKSARRKISIALTGHRVSLATRKKISKSKMGHHVLSSTRKKLSKSLSGRHISLSVRKNMSKGQKLRREMERQ